MIAKPKSEVWLLCLANDYQNDQTYENGPDNDNALNSLKNQLTDKVYPGRRIVLFHRAVHRKSS